MKRVVRSPLAAIPLDERCRRALDETLLDWEHGAWTGEFGRPVPRHTLIAESFLSWTLLVMPVALFLGASGQARLRTPFLGLALASLVVMAVTAGWMHPALNQAFREQVYESRGGHGELARGLTGMLAALGLALDRGSATAPPAA